MSANKKQFGLFSNKAMYNLDGANAMGIKPRPYHQSLFNFWTIVVILLATIGIVYLMHLTGMIDFILRLVNVIL